MFFKVNNIDEDYRVGFFRHDFFKIVFRRDAGVIIEFMVFPFSKTRDMIWGRFEESRSLLRSYWRIRPLLNSNRLPGFSGQATGTSNPALVFVGV